VAGAIVAAWEAAGYSFNCTVGRGSVAVGDPLLQGVRLGADAGLVAVTGEDAGLQRQHEQ
jgi:TPP-dependent indolepyruvate ferredoxin oxidoreductase alpha subunit